MNSYDINKYLKLLKVEKNPKDRYHNGILVIGKDGVVKRIEIDTKVTKGSNKLVTSGLLYDAIQNFSPSSSVVSSGVGGYELITEDVPSQVVTVAGETVADNFRQSGSTPAGAGSLGSQYLSGLLDVEGSGWLNGKVLVYNSATSKWEAETYSSGTTDHGALTGLGDDDHSQYHNNARGDARYSLLAHNHAATYLAIAAKAADSDKLNGQLASYYEAAFSKNNAFNKNFAGNGAAATPSRSDHNHDSSYLGSTGKAADSDKLDNLDSTQFLRSDESDTCSGTLTATNFIQG